MKPSEVALEPSRIKYHDRLAMSARDPAERVGEQGQAFTTSDLDCGSLQNKVELGNCQA